MLAGVTHGRGGDSSVFLFDIDASEEVTLAGAGAFDDVPGTWTGTAVNPIPGLPDHLAKF